MQLRTDLATSYSLLTDEKPEGLSVTRQEAATKAFGLNVDLNVVIDVARIIPEVAALWFVARIAPAIKRGVKMYVDGKLLPPEEGCATQMIKDAIDAPEEQQGANK